MVKERLCNAGDAGLLFCQRTKISHATEYLSLHVSNRVYMATSTEFAPFNRESYHKEDLHARLRANTAK